MDWSGELDQEYQVWRGKKERTGKECRKRLLKLEPLRGNMKTQYNKSFGKQMYHQRNLYKMPRYLRKQSFGIEHLLPSNAVSYTRIGLYLIESLSNVVPWKSLNNPCCYEVQVALHKVMTRLYSGKQHLDKTLNMEKQRLCL